MKIICTVASIVGAELLPYKDKQKIIDMLTYFFLVCDEHMSPQCLWETNNCSYNSLLLDYESKQDFDTILSEIIKQFPALQEPKNLIE